MISRTRWVRKIVLDSFFKRTPLLEFMARFEPSKRLENVSYAIRDVVLEARKVEASGRKVLYLNIGDPCVYDFQTPRHLIEAVSKAMLSGKNSYAPSEGLKEAREAVAQECGREGFKASPEDVLLGYGASEGIWFALTALLNPGENVLTPSPGYPQYTSLINLLGAKPNEYPCLESEDWEPDFDAMRKRVNAKTKAVVVINPNNPTGAVYSKKTPKGVLDLAGEHNLVVLADEIYSKLVYGEGAEFHAMASLSNDVPVVTFSGLSKNYLAPGWRTGWSVFHDPQQKAAKVRDAMLQLGRVRLSTTYPFQFAVKAALEGPQGHLIEVNDKLRRRADLLFSALNEPGSGVSVVKPKGAFYAFAKIQEKSKAKDDKKFTMDLLKEQGVLTVFGSGFGGGPAKGHFRIVFLPKEDVLREACGKIKAFASRN
ncbi:MAG TPA: aminotransferase class I/II-fold pyridoxal phosphate-dependent enzyme [archaeon]|nr:aminotransferase class I/II-fold pyridoxal phosphate-dependent enzyme [archaeon]